MSSPQDRLQGYVNQLDRELSRYPALVNLERTTSVPKAYGVIGLVGVYFFLVVFNFGGQFLTNFAGFIIPAYYSVEALFTTTARDDTQWLTYWVVFAFLSVIESLLNPVYWFPFYFTFKFVFLLWLSLPVFRGSEIVFRSLLAPVLSRYFTYRASTGPGLRAKIDGAIDKAQ